MPEEPRVYPRAGTASLAQWKSMRSITARHWIDTNRTHECPHGGNGNPPLLHGGVPSSILGGGTKGNGRDNMQAPCEGPHPGVSPGSQSKCFCRPTDRMPPSEGEDSGSNPLRNTMCPSSN